MFITRKSVPRRTFLKGVGAAVSLPLLDAMVPAATALAQTAAEPAPRFAFLYVPHGAIMDQWTPLGEGTSYELSATLKPLERVRAHVNVVSNLIIDAPNSHTLSSAMWLNGTQPRFTTPEDLYTGVTVDQLIAARHGQDTPLPSLELAIEDFSRAVGNCEANTSCIYMNTLSWRTPETPLTHETNPRVVFERLFGEGASETVRAARRAQSKSILDSIAESLGDLRRGLGARDRARLDGYLENVREVERRIDHSEHQAQFAVPDAPVGIPESYDEHAKLMYDLQVLAFQADATRVSAFMLARELSQQTYGWVGAPEPHHTVSHHQEDPRKIAEHVAINLYQVSLLARFIEALRDIPDGTGSLLDHSLILYGSGMSNGNGHTHDPLPLILAGGANGRLAGGRHIVAPPRTRMSNLLLAILHKAGVEQERLGDSTGALDV